MRKVLATGFASAILVPHSASLAMTQDEAIAAIRQQVSQGGGGPTGSAYAWMAITALTLSIVLLVMRRRRGEQARKPALNDPAKLLKEVRRQAGLSRADLRRLRHAAAAAEQKTGVKVTNPLVMILCPSLKGAKR